MNFLSQKRLLEAGFELFFIANPTSMTGYSFEVRKSVLLIGKTKPITYKSGFGSRKEAQEFLDELQEKDLRVIQI